MNLPKVGILMAIYKPNMKWLEEQLMSLNEQTYLNLELIIWNDYPEDQNSYDDLLKRCITKMSYEIHKGEQNLGPTKAFEKLTKITEGREDIKYLAYCDQDDIWLRGKISVLVEHAEKENLDLVCSDATVIDKDGNFVCDSYHEQLNQLTYFIENYTANNLFALLLHRDFVLGCTMLINKNIACAAAPFSKAGGRDGHDYWLGLYVAGTRKKFKYLRTSLIKHRRHEESVSHKLRFMADNLEQMEEYYKAHYDWLQDLKRQFPEIFVNQIHKDEFDRFCLSLILTVLRKAY